MPGPLQVVILKPSEYSADGVVERFRRRFRPNSYPTLDRPQIRDLQYLMTGGESFFVPDILANTGGVTVSYFEWVQNRSGLYWTEEDVHKRMKQIMIREFNNVYDLMQEHKSDMRTAAYVLALNRTGQAVEALGTNRFLNGKDT